jgi:alanine-glyoxylate transaminase/serine-glyoxylate transaminase/serine-pyruvate transaminase
VGEAIDPGKIESALKSSSQPRALSIVHAETSTGVLQDLSGLAELAHNMARCLIVDAVTSLGGHPVGIDRNGIDICYSGRRSVWCAAGTFAYHVQRTALDRIRRERERSRAGIWTSRWLSATGAMIALIIIRRRSQ